MTPHRDSKETVNPEVVARAMDEASTTTTKTMDVVVVATHPTKGDSRAPAVPRGPILVSVLMNRPSSSGYGELEYRTPWFVCV